MFWADIKTHAFISEVLRYLGKRVCARKEIKALHTFLYPAFCFVAFQTLPIFARCLKSFVLEVRPCLVKSIALRSPLVVIFSTLLPRRLEVSACHCEVSWHKIRGASLCYSEASGSDSSFVCVVLILRLQHPHCHSKSHPSQQYFEQS